MSGSCGESVCRTTEILTRFPNAEGGREGGLGDPPRTCPENARLPDKAAVRPNDPEGMSTRVHPHSRSRPVSAHASRSPCLRQLPEAAFRSARPAHPLTDLARGAHGSWRPTHRSFRTRRLSGGRSACARPLPWDHRPGMLRSLAGSIELSGIGSFPRSRSKGDGPCLNPMPSSTRSTCAPIRRKCIAPSPRATACAAGTPPR